MEDFQYVVERKKPEKICFGSSGERDTSFIPKRINQVSPASYELNNLTSGTFQLLNKVRSRKGVGGLASDAPRFRRKVLMQIPSPTRYDLRYQYGKKQSLFAAFGTNVKRTLKVNNLPGPGTYKAGSQKCRKTRFAHNLGHPTMIPTVKVYCKSRFTDKCDRCGTICKGDYWERNHGNYLCHACWTDERYDHEMYSQEELKHYKKIRTCEFKHCHNGTTAAIRLLPDNDIQKMERIENYLDLFISC